MSMGYPGLKENLHHKIQSQSEYNQPDLWSRGKPFSLIKQAAIERTKQVDPV